MSSCNIRLSHFQFICPVDNFLFFRTFCSYNGITFSNLNDIRAACLRIVDVRGIMGRACAKQWGAHVQSNGARMCKVMACACAKQWRAHGDGSCKWGMRKAIERTCTRQLCGRDQRDSRFSRILENFFSFSLLVLDLEPFQFHFHFSKKSEGILFFTFHFSKKVKAI